MPRSDACQLRATGHSSSRPQDSFWNREWASFLITINLQGGQTPGSLLVIRFSSVRTLENGREQSLTLLTSAGFTRRARSSRHQTGSELSNVMRFVQWKLKRTRKTVFNSPCWIRKKKTFLWIRTQHAINRLTLLTTTCVYIQPAASIWWSKSRMLFISFNRKAFISYDFQYETNKIMHGIKSKHKFNSMVV